MSKRARQMALMGFAQGALADVMKRREQARLEEAEARKEARLAAIRAQERSEDHAYRKELTQYELGERRAMQTEELGARRELTTLEIDARERINAADNASRAADRAAAREDRAAARAEAREDRKAQSRAPKLESYVGERSGRTVNFNVNDPNDVRALREWQRVESVRPAAAAGIAKPDDAPGMMGAPPRAADLRFDPKTGRLVPAR